MARYPATASAGAYPVADATQPDLLVYVTGSDEDGWIIVGAETDATGRRQHGCLDAGLNARKIYATRDDAVKAAAKCVDQLVLEDSGMEEYTVCVTRTDTSTCEIEVTAKDDTSACEKAKQMINKALATGDIEAAFEWEKSSEDEYRYQTDAVDAE